MQGALALAYLVIFSCCFAYTAYAWLARHATPAQVGTYSYVNPAIAAVVGYSALGETLSPVQIVGGVVILGGVLMINWPAEDHAPALLDQHRANDARDADDQGTEHRARQKLAMVNPGSIHATSASTAPLITSRNRPSVSTVVGRVRMHEHRLHHGIAQPQQHGRQQQCQRRGDHEAAHQQSEPATDPAPQ